ncbi:MAG: hypothetical protein LAP13_20110, partial [Acidobacteriia bacterium]|nr:hypothetical protein [Terriglobia bacterium]
MQITGLPTGVTVSPTSVTLTPGTPQSLTFSASASTPASNANVTLTGTSGSLTHSATLGLKIETAVTSNTPPFRMRYVRTDAATPYYLWRNSHWIVYNPPTSRFFVTDPYSNRVFVLDAATQSLIGTILVPGAFGIDDTPDHMTLYVGTQIGDVYAIDPVGMTVTKRYPSAGIGPFGYAAYSVQVMADGRLALLGGQGGQPSVGGYQTFAIWDPVDNSISIFATTYSAPGMNIPHTIVCGSLMGNIGVFTRTPDRTRVIVSSVFSDGTLCEIDEATGSSSYVQVGDSLAQVIVSPDGRWIVFPAPAPFYNQVEVYDAGTLSQVAMFNVAGDTSSAAGLFVGPDSKTLYTPSRSTVYAYDLTTGQTTGWFPNFFVTTLNTGMAYGPITGPNVQAMDGTGLVAGPMEEGVGFLDLTAMRAGAVGTQYTNQYLSPATGPTGGGTQVSWPAAGTITDVYFGSQKATSVSGSSGTISVTTPPGSPGPADVYSLASDGGVQLIPQGFSYGPTVLQITPNAATAEGDPGIIYGYGFGPTTSTTIPTGLRVTVAGKPAQITAFNGNAYNAMAPPLPLEAFAYTIPSGTTGPADVTVTSSSGSVTVQGGITYLPAIQQFPLIGAFLAQGIYDSQRNLYYFTDASNIRVFSRTSGTWLSPIIFPADFTPVRLWGIALSPDGSQLAVADAQGKAIYVLSPENASTVKKYPIPQPLTGVIVNPTGVAISDAGIVYFGASTNGGTGYDVYFKLDTSTGQVTDYQIGTNSGSADNYLQVKLRSDNSLVYGNDDGTVVTIDTATDKVTYAKVNPGCCYGNYELTLSGDETRLAATNYFYDASLNAESSFGLNLREMMNVSYVYGQKLSPDGTLLFQPSTNGIDVLDARLGVLLKRIALPVTLSPNYDALVSDGRDNVLLAITGTDG